MTLDTNTFYLTTMTSLCIGDSHIKRLKKFVGKNPSSIVYSVDSLSKVIYYGIRGGRVSNHRHLVSLTSAVSRIRPSHVIVMMGSKELDSADPYFDVECLVFRLIAFLTQLRNTNQLVSKPCLASFIEKRPDLCTLIFLNKGS